MILLVPTVPKTVPMRSPLSKIGAAIRKLDSFSLGRYQFKIGRNHLRIHGFEQGGGRNDLHVLFPFFHPSLQECGLIGSDVFKLAQNQAFNQRFGGIDRKHTDDAQRDKGKHQKKKHQLGLKGEESLHDYVQ
jgi:hypothetical protein